MIGSGAKHNLAKDLRDIYFEKSSQTREIKVCEISQTLIKDVVKTRSLENTFFYLGQRIVFLGLVHIQQKKS